MAQNGLSAIDHGWMDLFPIQVPVLVITVKTTHLSEHLNLSLAGAATVRDAVPETESPDF